MSDPAKVSQNDEETTTYVVRQKICRGMICTFLLSLIIITVASLWFFIYFIDETLELSVTNTFLAHLNAMVQDVIQVKRNDFMLVQNELKIAGILIMDLIQRNNFNARSLGGPSLNDLTNFRANCESLYYTRRPGNSTSIDKTKRRGIEQYNKAYGRSKDFDFTNQGENDKVFWLSRAEAYDVPAFESQVIRRLRQQPLDPNYKDMTVEEIDDIITCASSKFLRSGYSLDFQYTDLNKVKNFIAFESGVMCFFPAPEMTFPLSVDIRNGDGGFDDVEYNAKRIQEYKDMYTDKERQFKLENYGSPCPRQYDPRCRGWYMKQHQKDHQTLTDLYKFASG